MKKKMLFVQPKGNNSKKKSHRDYMRSKLKTKKKEDLFRCILRDKDIEDYQGYKYPLRQITYKKKKQ